MADTVVQPTGLEVPATPRPAPRPWLGLCAILAATLMNLLDSTVINIAVPSIRADLGGSYSSVQWIAASYTLALAVGMLTGGRLGDRFGRRRMLLIGVVGFVAASVACAVAWSPESLIVARVVQGLFGAVMLPQSFGLIRDLFSPSGMGKAFAAFAPAIGLSTVLGPIVAGVLTDADLFGTGWRMVFLINLLLGGFALAAGLWSLPAGTRVSRPARLDLVGAALAAVGMFLLVFPLVQGRELGWPQWTFGMLVAAVVVLAGFVLHQRWRKRTVGAALVELSVFTRRSYTSGVVFVVVFFGALAGFGLAVGLFLQLGLGYGPMRASLTMASWALGAFIGSALSAALARLGRRLLHCGLSLILVGLAALYVVLGRAGTVDSLHLVPPLAVFGFGMGMIFVPLFDIIMGEIDDHEVGSASGALEAMQQLGASLGVAVLGTVFFGAIGAQATGETHRLAFLTAAQRTTLVTIGLTGLAFLLGFLLPRRARSQHPPKEAST